MKKTALLALLVLAPVVGCQTALDAEVVAATHTATLDITGMTCASCSVTVKAAVNKLDGIASIEVDTDAGQAVVAYDGERVTAEQIAQAVTDAGYATTVAGVGG